MDDYPSGLRSPASSLSFRRRARTERWGSLRPEPSRELACPEDCAGPSHMALDSTVSQFLAAASSDAVWMYSLGVEGGTEGTVRPIQSRALHDRPGQSVVGLSWLPHDNGIIFSSHSDGRLHLWQSDALAIVETIRPGDRIYGHCMSESLSTMHASLAVACTHNVALIDIRTGAAVQRLSKTGSQPVALAWDASNEFCLYSGDRSGGIYRWDVRRASGERPVLLHQSLGKDVWLCELDLLGTESLIFTSLGGVLGAVSPGTGELLWQAELDFHPDKGSRAAVIEDTADPLLLLPAEETVQARNLRTGEEEWRKGSAADIRHDSLIYNHERCELYSLESGRGPIYAISV